QHIKPEKRTPMAFYVFVSFLILTAVFIYFSVDRVLSKTSTPKEESQHELFSDNQTATPDQANIQTVSNSEEGTTRHYNHTNNRNRRS
ncbi:MAG: hypothetical protein KDC65_18725, partial [Saprospiraceae bacterium]|nr:hypothetical protein [Saprospiraceae bacterium]